MGHQNNSLKILYLNTYGQTKFTSEKQLQVQDMIIHLCCDIIHLQETDCNEASFQHCSFIQNNFTLITNNSATKFGTSSLIKNNLCLENIAFDTEGRVILFYISGITFCNIYLQAGTEALSRSAREQYCGEIIPNLMVNRVMSSVAGGDWNCIIDKVDATHHPASKISPTLSRLVKSFGWKDSFRICNGNIKHFSHYYTSGDQVGATRIDREYMWGEVEVLKSEYIPCAFSDHLGLLSEVKVTSISSKKISPRGSPFLKIRDEVAGDKIFQHCVAESMENWKLIRCEGLNVLTWWELVVKPGLQQIALARSKEMNREQKGELNILLVRQAYLVKKLRNNLSSFDLLSSLHSVQILIRDWYKRRNKKIQTQSREKEFQLSEGTRIYHHELHRKKMNKSSILSLETEEGLLEGHEKCAAYLENKVCELLGVDAYLDPVAQATLLDEVSRVFTDADNVMFESMPTKQELLDTIKSSNLKAAAGTDGIPGLVYKECWGCLGDPLHDVVTALFSGEDLTVSMRKALMIFSTKPKKPNSRKPSDKRRISILNCDFKLYEGLYARRFRKLACKSLSPLQYVAGTNRTIQHGIARARDAINAATRSGLACGIGDQDYVQAFDFLVLSWVWMVLEKKGVLPTTLTRLKGLFKSGITIPVVNNIPGRAILDRRGSLRQGGVGSMEWFGIGIDPLEMYLEERLAGIPVPCLPVQGPVQENEEGPLPPSEERFKLMAFCDDMRPAICSLQEFVTCDTGASLFERAAGTKLHRDPSMNKCKFLPLGKWRRCLTQDDIPTPYMRITDTHMLLLSCSWPNLQTF